MGIVPIGNRVYRGAEWPRTSMNAVVDDDDAIEGKHEVELAVVGLRDFVLCCECRQGQRWVSRKWRIWG